MSLWMEIQFRGGFLIPFILLVPSYPASTTPFEVPQAMHSIPYFGINVDVLLLSWMLWVSQGGPTKSIDLATLLVASEDTCLMRNCKQAFWAASSCLARLTSDDRVGHVQPGEMRLQEPGPMVPADP